MQTPITRTCGHTTTENLFGSRSDRERKEAYLKNQPCTTCKREAETRSASVQAEAQNLPNLTGSEKQINWALHIRAEKLASVEAFLIEAENLGRAQNAPEEQIQIAMTALRAGAGKVRSQSSAAWWIDHRNDSGRQLLATVN